MTNLEDIQQNTSEFNISFHLKEFVGQAMMQVFMFKPNKDKLEEVMKLEVEPKELKPTLIGNLFNDIVKAYLAEAFDDEPYKEDCDEVD